MKSSYFTELTRNLQHEGLMVGSENPSSRTGRSASLSRPRYQRERYWLEDVSGDSRSAALDKVKVIVRTTAEYMREMETVPLLTVRAACLSILRRSEQRRKELPVS